MALRRTNVINDRTSRIIKFLVFIRRNGVLVSGNLMTIRHNLRIDAIVNILLHLLVQELITLLINVTKVDTHVDTLVVLLHNITIHEHVFLLLQDLSDSKRSNLIIDIAEGTRAMSVNILNVRSIDKLIVIRNRAIILRKLSMINVLLNINVTRLSKRVIQELASGFALYKFQLQRRHHSVQLQP